MTTTFGLGIGIGAVGVGGDHVPTHRKRPDLCAGHDHPGVTYNPWLNRTWCLCGEVVVDGNTATHDACCCGGRLIDCLPSPSPAQPVPDAQKD